MKGPASRFLDMAWLLLVTAPLLVAAEVAPAQTYAGRNHQLFRPGRAAAAAVPEDRAVMIPSQN